MKTATVLVAAIFVVLVEFPESSAAPCDCSGQKELPARLCGESDVAYYKRIFTVESSSECSVTSLYKNVFYEYKGESRESYVKRIDTIFGSVYTNLDCRFDIKRQNFLEKYYSFKYCKKSNENDEEYFERILTKTSESECVYKSKVELLKKFVKKVDWSKIKVEEKTKKGFSLISKITRSTRSNDCQEKTKKNENNKSKKNKESCGCQQKKKECSCGESKKRDSEKRKETNEENKRKIEQSKKDHCNNVKKIREQEEEHRRNEKKIKEQEEEHKRNEMKIKEQEEEKRKNERKIKEQEEEHKRNEKKIKEREVVHAENVKKVEEKEKTHNENVLKIEAKKKEHEENVRKWVKANYCRKSNEDTETYYKRICSKTVTSNEEYIERMTIAKSLYHDLDLWYSDKYLSETKEFYTQLYSRKTTETEEQYFRRLVTKENYESEENCAKRILLLYILFPKLSIWSESKYYETYTKTFYQTYFRKQETETNEVYLKRVFTRVNGECEENFWKRIKFIQETFPDYNCWYDKENLQKLEVCRSISDVKSEAELRQRIEAENQSKGSCGCSRAKIECLQVFFKSSKSTKSSQSSEEQQEVSYTSKSS